MFKLNFSPIEFSKKAQKPWKLRYSYASNRVKSRLKLAKECDTLMLIG